MARDRKQIKINRKTYLLCIVWFINQVNGYRIMEGADERETRMIDQFYGYWWHSYTCMQEKRRIYLDSCSKTLSLIRKM